MVSRKRENINDHNNNSEDKKTNYLTDLTSILPPPMDIYPIFGTNQAERNISKKHRPTQKELLDKSNLHADNNEVTTQPIIPSARNLVSTIIKNSQKQNSSNIIQTYKKASHEQNLDSLGNKNINKLIIKDKVTTINTITQKSHRHSNSSLESEWQLTINSNNSIPEKENIFPAKYRIIR